MESAVLHGDDAPSRNAKVNLLSPPQCNTVPESRRNCWMLKHAWVGAWPRVTAQMETESTLIADTETLWLSYLLPLAPQVDELCTTTHQQNFIATEKKRNGHK